MSENKNNDSNFDSTDSAEDLNWLELEDEEFDDDVFPNDSIDDTLSDTQEPVRANSKKAKISNKKKSSPLTLIGLLIVIFGAGGLYYTESSKLKTKNNIPIIELSDAGSSKTIPTAEELNTLRDPVPLPLNQTTNQEDILQDNTETKSENAGPEEIVSDDIAQQNVIPAIQNDGVLTPLPDPQITDDIDLLPLVQEQQTAQLHTDISDDKTENTLNNLNEISLVPTEDSPAAPLEQINELNEAKLIEKTDNNPVAATQKSEIKEESKNELVDNSNEKLPLIEGSEVLNQKTIEPEEIVKDKQNDLNNSDLIEKPINSDSNKDISAVIEATNLDNSKSTADGNKTATTPITSTKKEVNPTPASDVNTQKINHSNETIKAQSNEVTQPEKTVQVLEKVEKKPTKKVTYNWKLKSAQPGMAIIFDNATGNSLSIETGSYVEGIGRIKSIAKVNGSWKVIGTSGSISQ